MLGYENTLAVTMDEMLHHLIAGRRRDKNGGRVASSAVCSSELAGMLVRLDAARTSSPANTSEKPQLSSEVSMLASATKPTAPRPVRGHRASRSISRAIAGAVATT